MADLFNEFDSLIKQEKQATNTNMNFNVGSAANANPDQEVFFKDLSKRTGLPIESLRLDGGKEAKRQALLAEAEMIPSHAPATGTWLARSDGTKVAIAADSFDELAGMERLLHPKSKGGSTLGIASPQDQAIANTARPYFELFKQSIEKAPASIGKGINESIYGLNEVIGWNAAQRMMGIQNPGQPLLDNMKWYDDAIKGVETVKPETTGQQYASQIFDTVSQNLLLAPLGIAGKTPMLATFAATAGGQLEDYMKAGYSPMQSALFSLSNKAMEGLTELIGVGRLYKGGNSAARRILEFMGGDLLGEEINNAYKSLLDKGTLKPDMTLDDFKKSVLDTAIVTIGAAGMQGAMTQPFAKLSQEYQASKQAAANQQFFDTLNDQVKNGKLQKRDVETFEDFVAHVANEQGGIDEVRVPAEQWAEYWQSAGIDPVSIAVEVIGEEGAVQFQEALATGGDVVMPFEKFAGRIVGTDHYEGLKQDLRFGDSWTVREAQYFEQNKDALLDEAMAEHERIMNDPVEASSQSVYENIYGQLSQIMPQDQAHLQAVMASENIRSRATRLGVDPLALYNERPINVGREFADGGGQVLGQGDWNKILETQREIATTPLAEGVTELDVDGTMRPALNSNGKPIHATEEGIRNFWRWFSPPVRDRFQLSDSEKSSLKRDTKTLSDFLESKTGLAQTQSFLPVPSAVVSAMSGVVNNDQILNAVVASLPVDVVDFFSGQKLSPKDALGNVSMLKDVLTINPESPVSLGVNPTTAVELLVRTIADAGAEITGLTSRSLKLNSTRLADANDSVFGTHNRKDTRNNLRFQVVFGESKVVDDQGRPMVVYHGTDKDFTEFLKTQDIGYHFGTTEQAGYRHGKSEGGNILPVYLKIDNPIALPDHTWDTPRTILDYIKNLDTNGELAKAVEDWEKAKSVKVTEDVSMEEYRKLINEYHSNVKSAKDSAMRIGRELLSQTGDGVVYSNNVEGSGDSYIAFSPNQIKSATGNSGSFDGGNANILFQSAPEYGMNHRPPGPDDGAPLHDVTGNGIYPDDIYSNKGLQFYGTGQDQADRESMAVIHSTKGKPNATVTIYRAVPKELTNAEQIAKLEKEKAAYLKRGKAPADSPFSNGNKWYEWASSEIERLQAAPENESANINSINPGDWVTLSRSYAKDHGEGALNGKYKIISKKVKASELFTNGDSLNEFGYWPEDKESMILYQSAWHGTPHTFDKFSTSAIGTGEGAQAYGYGLYFAGNKEVAEWYRQQLSQKSINKNNVMVDTELGRMTIHQSELPSISPTEDEIRRYYEGLKSEAEQEYKWQKKLQGKIKFDPNDYETEFDQDVVDEYFSIGKEVDRYKSLVDDYAKIIAGKITPINAGRLYKVELAPAEDEYLLWDKPLSEQSEKVREALSSDKKVIEARSLHEFFDANDKWWDGVGPTGKSAYLAAESVLGSDKAASEYLHSLGIRGIKYLDGNSRSGKKEDYNYVIFSDDDVEIQEMFQRNNNTPRGKVELRPDAFNITLLQNADLTTFTHELGHTWLEQLRADALRADAPEQIKQDWQTIKEWAGIADDAGQIQTEAHETFARGVEAYLMEGKAPSSKLEEVFARVAEWMKLVYKSLTTLNVELNDEVRAVFDRMLASDEEIKAARQRQQYKPLFATAEEAGMTPEQFDLYVKQNSKAMDAAEKKLRDRLMKQITREREKWWKLELANMKEEVRKEAQEMPVYQATQLLTKGEDFDGNKPDIPVKLDKDTLVKLYGEDYLKKLPRGFGYAYTTQNGAHPDDVAALFGYASGDEMLQAITEAPKLKDYVKQEAERRMQEKHNDLPPIAELADEAVHNDLQAEVLRNEMRILSKAKKQGDAAVRVADKADRAARNEAMDTIPSLEMFRLAAAQAINSKTLREIKPHLYLSAEQKAGRKAFDLAAKGKYPEAAEAKRQQLLNHFLYREALKAQEFAEKVYNYTNRMQKRPAQERLGKAQGGYLEQFNGLLEKYEFKQVSDKEIDRRTSLLEWAKNKADQGEEVAISEDILIDQPRNYRMLTMQELQGLYDALKNIDHLAKMQLELIVDGQAIAYDDAAAMLIGAAETNYKRKPMPIDRETQSWIEKQAEKLQTFDASLIKVEQLFTWLDGGRIDGPWQTLIFRQLSKSQTDEMDMSVEYAQKIYDLFDQYTTFQGSGWIGTGMMAKRHFKGIGQELTKQATLAVALNTGNEGNLQRLLDGYGWNENQLNEILDTLTPEDADFVQNVWDTINEMWPHIEKLEKELTGVAPEKIEPRQVTIAGKTLNGGYYPAVGDPRQSETGERQADAKAERLFGGNYVRATTEKGHTKARTDKAKYRILLNLEVIPQHMAQVMHDLAYRRSVLQVNKLINRKDVAAAIKETMGVPYHRLLNKWLANVANDANIDRTGADFWTRFMSRLRTNSQIVSMGFKASTMTSQISGFLTSMDMVKPKYLMHAVQQTMRNPLAMTRAVREKSGEMRHRANMLDRDVRDGVRKAMGKKGTWSGMQAMAFHGIAIADAMVSVPTWWGAYQQGLAEGMDETDATAFADRAVRLSQGAGGAKDLSAVQQKSEFTKLITMFYSYFNVLYSRFRDVGTTSKMTPAGFATIAWRSLILWMIPAVLSEMLAGRMPPDDDDDKQEWFLKKTLAYPFMVIPFVRDIVNSIESGRDYALSPITTVGQKIVKLARQADDISSGYVESDKLLLDIIDVFGYSVGAPTGQLKITGRYLWEVWQGDADPENAAQFMHDLIFARERKK